MESRLDPARIGTFHETLKRIEEEVARDMVGQREVVRQVLVTLVAGGNALLEGVPGLGKTHLVRTLSRVLDLPFSRIQFTPDLMPADITGTNIVAAKDGETKFTFQPGPIFASLVLADEINRATPKTQSALLEAMQERSVTAGGATRPLPQPFFVLATQNPIEQEGTYPLPEAQLDRFLFKINVPFPTMDELRGIVDLPPAPTAQKVADAAALLELRQVASEVLVARAVRDYALKMVLYTHPDGSPVDEIKKYARYGASPRAAQALLAAGRVWALMEGRYNVAFGDIRAVAAPVLRHRILLSFDGVADGVTTESLLAAVVARVELEANA